MKRILFIGNFLSKKRGTKLPMESIMNSLRNSGVVIKSASRFENKFLRLGEMLFKTAFCKIDAIHIDVFSGSAFTFADYVSQIAKFRNIKIIFNLRGGRLPEFCNANVLSVLNRGWVILTPSMYLKEFFIAKGLNIEYMPNPVFTSKFEYKSRYSTEHYLLWVRAFDKIYNPLMAAETLNEVLKTYPDTTLTMVGPDKGLMEIFRSKIRELGIENMVNIVGMVDNDKLSAYYHECSVFLNTTSFESFGNAVMEAATCGIPIVSTKVGEIPYLWKDGENILMIDNLDPKEMAKCVCIYFENFDLYESISKKAAERSREFDWEITKFKWNDLICRV